MKKYRIIAGASAAVLTLSLMTACGSKQEEPVQEEQPVVQEEIQTEAPAVQPEVEIQEQEPAETEQEAPTEEAEDSNVESELAAPAQQTIEIAQLTEIAEDGAMTILPYAPADGGEILAMEDYANVDFGAYVAAEETEALELADQVMFQLAQDGELSEADESALTVGSMLVIITDADGVQTIVIHNPVAEEAA